MPMFVNFLTKSVPPNDPKLQIRSSPISPNLSNPALFVSKALIGNEWINADSGSVLEVQDPATGAVIGTVPNLGTDEARRAIAAAEDARAGWQASTAHERSAVLRRWYNLILENLEDLAILLTREQGKPLAEARAEIQYGASFIEWFAEEAKRAYGDVIPSPKRDSRILVQKQGIGVTAAITPWNFPSAMITRKCAPALAAGCTVVIKPSELTPFSATALGALAIEAGFPAGVLNIVIGDPKAIGGELTSNPAVRKISFTGSTPVGKILAAQSSSTLKKLSLELGGNAPLIVFDDADIEVAVQGVLNAKFRNAGQACVAANRILVQSGIYETFVARLASSYEKLTVGSGFEEGASIGPLIDQRAVSKVEAHVSDAVAKGASVVCGGKRHALGGTFYEPTLIRDAIPSMQLSLEETFGPVAALYRFETENEAIELANTTPYGLAAYVFTNNLSRTWRVVDALEVGMVGVNDGKISNEVAPFGGVKESGYGREGSKYGLDEYLTLKYIMIA